MKIGDSNFVNLFSRIAAASNPLRDRDEWTISGVHWRRQRFLNWGPDLSFQVVHHCLRHGGRKPWSLLAVQEIWWGEDRETAIRNAHWMRVEHGSRKEVLDWFKARENEMT